MSGPTEIAARQERILAELSELGLALARRLQEQALAAEEPEATAQLAGAFHRVSRSVRQSLALAARFERDRQRQDREDGDAAEAAAKARIERRKARVKATVERLIWTEVEGADHACDAIDSLHDLLNEDALGDGFEDQPVAAYIRRLRFDLGLDELPHDTPELGLDGERPPPRGVYRKPWQPDAGPLIPTKQLIALYRNHQSTA